MIESTMPTGTNGTLIIDDQTDGPDKTVDLYIESSTSIAIPQLPWAYTIDGVTSSWQQFNFQNLVTKQHLGLVYVGFAESFTLHIGATGTVQMGGPTDMTIALNQAGVKTVSIKVGTVYKQAIPYVNVAGVWKPAEALVMDASIWKPAT